MEGGAHEVRLPAHPRVGGENDRGGGTGADDEGSSPRRRGKQDNGVGRDEPQRLIPA